MFVIGSIPIDSLRKNEYYSRAVSSPFPLSSKHARYPLSRATHVHRVSTNRRNKIPNYPWKNHDKIVRNWHPSICIRSFILSPPPPIIDRASNEQLTNVLFPSFFPPREIKRIKKKCVSKEISYRFVKM